MASRTSAGVGVVVTLTILGITSLTLFILTIVFLSKNQAAQKELEQMRVDNSQFVTDAERNRDDVRTLLSQASQDRQSLVGYLMEAQDQTMTWVTGSAADTVEQLEAKLGRIEGGTTTPLLAILDEKESEIAHLEERLATANAERAAALEDLQNEVVSKQALASAHAETIAALEAQIAEQRAQVDTYRSQVQEATANMDERVARIQSDLQAEKDDLAARLSSAQQLVLDLEEQLARLRDERGDETLRPLPEAGLVDGRILQVYPGQGEVIIGRGRDDNVVLGMTFAVYSDGTIVRPDESGRYPRGKASIEVISIGDTSSRARITSSIEGDPIIPGDTIANAVYDPQKVYRFVVYGNFDTNRDGLWTSREREVIAALIEEWGGEVTDDLSGDVDFLVLGSQPVLPPEPNRDAPFELIEEYIRLREIVDKYDELLSRAQATSIPVLNQNSLATLIGR